MRFVLGIIVLSAICETTSFGGNAPAPARRPFPFAVAQPLGPAADRVDLVPDAEQIRAIAAHEHLILVDVELPGGDVVAFDVHRLDLHRLRFGVRWNGELAPDALERTNLSVWTGTVDGEPDSEVVLGLAPGGCRGWLRRGGELVHLLAGPGAAGWGSPVARWTRDATLKEEGHALGAFCRADARESRDRALTPAPSGAIASSTLLECRIAMEGDYQLYQAFANAGAELTYVVTLLAAVSSRYEQQIGVILTFPYLNLWTTPNDPWKSQDTGGDSHDVLFELRNQWAGKIPANAHLGHLLSGAPLGGGVAWLDALCDSNFGFGVSGDLDGQVGFPLVQQPMNWDFVVIAHEIGHNFAALHTHEECPPLDECAPSAYFGPCQSQQTCSSQGTIMSYCQLCPGGTANITTYFHAAQIPIMRAAAENSCLSAATCGHAALGAGLGGANVATLGSADSPEPCHAVSFLLSNAPADGVALALLGTTPEQASILGGTLLVGLAGAAFLPITVAGGSGSFALPIPPASGLTIYSQVLGSTPTLPLGWYFSNGLATTICPYVPPPAPTGLKVAAMGSDWVALAWTDNATDEVAYRVAKLDPGENPSNPDQWDNVGGNLPANTTTFTVGGLTPNATYQFKVRGKNGCGDFSPYSNVVAGTPGCPPLPGPTALKVVATGPDWIEIAWTDNATDEVAYRVAKLDPGENPSNPDQWDNVGGDLPANTTTFTVGGLATHATYQFKVRCKNACDDLSAYSNVVAGTPSCGPLPAPSGLVVTAVTFDSVCLAWNDHATNEVAYRVARLDPGEDPSNMAHWDNVSGDLPPNTTTFCAFGLDCGGKYQFKVRCRNVCGDDSAYSNAVIVTTPTPPAPPAPTNCLAQRIGNTPQPDPIKISWSYSGPPVSGFRVARLDPDENPDDPAAWDNVGGNLPPSVHEYVDTFNLTNGKIYYYKVRAFVDTPCGKVYSPYSNIDAGKP